MGSGRGGGGEVRSGSRADAVSDERGAGRAHAPRIPTRHDEAQKKQLERALN
jgi:hypothetical protein